MSTTHPPHPSDPRRKAAHRAEGGSRTRTGILVLLVATMLAIWFGLSAPDVSPVGPPAPASGADATVVAPTRPGR
jgi:hypothetical protein